MDYENEKEAIDRENDSRVRSNESEGEAIEANIGRVTSLRDVPGSCKILIVFPGLTAIGIEC